MIPILLELDLPGPMRNAAFILLPLAGSVLLAYGLFNATVDLRRGARKKVIDRLKGTAAVRDKDAEFDFTDFRKHTTEAAGFMGKAFARWSFTARFQRALDQANIPWSAAQTLVNLTATASCLLALLLVCRVPPLATMSVAGAVFGLPLMYLFRRRTSRLKKLVNQLPDVFELLSQALRAGHSLASGMQVIAKQLPDPAGTEFGRVFHEQNLGMKVEDALRNLADRVDLLDVRFFVTAVLIQRQIGGDLAEVLDKIGTVIRERIKLFGTVQALTAEGRLSGYVLLALPLLVFCVMLKINAEYAKLLITDPLGKMMLTGAVVMQLMGWAMIKKIVNIKV
jgi:tight adherence protein B